MKVKIVKIEEEGDSLKVTVESEYGVDILGISKKRDEYDHLSGQPRWLIDVKNLLRKKYKNAKKPDKKEYVGQEIEL